eukprot:NODE_98_length_21025_cov_0.475055.p1 type:complete len:744 gc:universal NODE_98_length_21025_cov_0.475055:7752-5521(-)
MSHMLSYFAKHLHIGLRSETKTIWERRAALTPDACKELISNGNKISVESSQTRVFSNKMYSDAGATITDNLQSCDLIIGIKEVAIHEIIPQSKYLIFSHTHKGQPYNMNMLKAFIHRKCTLIDYELLTQLEGPEQGKRLVQFGTFAGYAGMINGLQALGKRLLGLGYWTPFMWLSQCHQYSRLENIRLDVQRVNEYIKTNGLPSELLPFTVVFTGKGSVSQGAMSIFSHLNHRFVLPEELDNLPKDPYTIFACNIDSSDYIVHKQGNEFNKLDFYDNPHHYKSIFHKTIAPFCSMLVTGHYWDKNYPRLVTLNQAQQLYANWKMNNKMLTLVDITCDPLGSLEFMPRASTIDDPYFIYDVDTKTEHRQLDSEGVMISSVDILPSELPRESSEYFSSKLLPLLLEYKPKIFENATIVKNGLLMPDFDYLNKSMDNKKINQIIVFGSGMVVQPLVEYLLKDPSNSITLATNKVKEANLMKQQIKKYMPTDRIHIISCDVSNEQLVDRVIEESDIAVSLVPALYHVAIANSCLRKRKHFVSASYISEEMRKLNDQAKSLGLTFLNEMGLDPGIDHTSARQLIDDIISMKGKITHFESWCGGLPAPEFSNTPLGYKFSWSPKGVLSASLNNAIYKLENKIVDSTNILKKPMPINIFKGFAMEGIPNRNSLSYVDQYQLKLEDLNVMFRGTLRYKGFCQLMQVFVDYKLLTQQLLSHGQSWASIVKETSSVDELKHNYGMQVYNDLKQ